MSIESNPAAKFAVMWFGATVLKRLRTMPREQVQKAANESSDICQCTPLHMVGPDKQFIVPTYSSEKLSGCQVIAVMVYGLWILCGENKEMCSSLYETWPIHEALLLVDGVKSAEANNQS